MAVAANQSNGPYALTHVDLEDPTLFRLNTTMTSISSRLAKVEGLASASASPDQPGTTVAYGTHAGRIAAVISGFQAGAVWFETDRGDVGYQLQDKAWQYTGGMMVGLLSSRPIDLTANDIDFVFVATDTVFNYRWNGGSWLTLDKIGALGIGGAGAPLYPLDIRNATPGPGLHVCDTGTDTGTYLMNLGDTTFVSNGAAWNGTNWIAKSVTAIIVQMKAGVNVDIFQNTGLTVGTLYSPALVLTMDGAGNVVFSGNVSGGGTSLSALLSALSGKAAHGTYTVTGGGGGSVLI